MIFLIKSQQAYAVLFAYACCSFIFTLATDCLKPFGLKTSLWLPPFGYRGVGFKSTTTISSEIVIYSSGAYFTFSKMLCAQKLNKDVDKVPTVRIPFTFEEKNLPNEVESAIENAESDGFTTFFIF